jgi:hypothetical protein
MFLSRSHHRSGCVRRPVMQDRPQHVHTSPGERNDDLMMPLPFLAFARKEGRAFLAAKRCEGRLVEEGTNIPQCSDVLLADKSWSARKESQAIARALRGENEWDVHAHHVITEHSIDTYTQQVVSFKSDSFNAGFDWGTPTTSDEEFLHLDVIFRCFCRELSELIGVHSHDLRKYLEKETSHVQLIAA